MTAIFSATIFRSPMLIPAFGVAVASAVIAIGTGCAMTNYATERPDIGDYTMEEWLEERIPPGTPVDAAVASLQELGFQSKERKDGGTRYLYEWYPSWCLRCVYGVELVRVNNVVVETDVTLANYGP